MRGGKNTVNDAYEIPVGRGAEAVAADSTVGQRAESSGTAEDIPTNAFAPEATQDPYNVVRQLRICARDWVQRPVQPFFRSDGKIRFQSLLSWIGFKDPEGLISTYPGLMCFNPCCRGLGSKTAPVSILPSQNVVFQSLLSWIGFKDSSVRRTLVFV